LLGVVGLGRRDLRVDPAVPDVEVGEHVAAFDQNGLATLLANAQQRRLDRVERAGRRRPVVDPHVGDPLLDDPREEDLPGQAAHLDLAAQVEWALHAPQTRVRGMPDLPLTGGCLCGGVRYELSATPLSARYCHCTRCQRRTGTASSVTARIVPGSLSIVSGEELVGEWKPEDGAAKVFCTRCGGALWTRDPENPGDLGVRMGTFDEDPGVRPSSRQYVAYAAAWEPIPDDGLPRYPERRPADA